MERMCFILDAITKHLFDDFLKSCWATEKGFTHTVGPQNGNV